MGFGRVLYIVVCLVASLGAIRAQGFSFSWTLSQAGPTTAGIYNAQGQLVRTIWAMEPLPAGTYQSTWDGLKDDRTPSAPGAYTWKVVGNHSVYTNVGTLGNTGLPKTSFGHIPYLIEGITTDAQKNIYTVHDWNEAKHDINRWSSTTGQATYNSGRVVDKFLLKAIAVEPDGSYAYVTGIGGVDDYTDWHRMQNGVFRIDLRQNRIENFTQAGRGIIVHDGNPNIPVGGVDRDEVFRMPLISIALKDGSIYVTDAREGRVLKYDKITGALQKEIKGLPLASGITVGSDGRIWVGYGHTKVNVYSAAGVLLASNVVSGLTEVRALSMQGNSLCVADRVGKILKFTVTGLKLSKGATFGKTALPGDTAPALFTAINGMTMDSDGCVIVSDRMGGGSRLQKFDAKNLPVWQQMGLEFSSQVAYGKENPDQLVSSFRNVYQVDRATANWTFLGPAGTDQKGKYFGNFENTQFGPPHIVRFGKTDFFYYPAGDSVAVYSIKSNGNSRGPSLILSAVLGGTRPGPDGVDRIETWVDKNRYLWSWVDDKGDGRIDYTSLALPNEVKVDAGPTQTNWKWDRSSAGVDDWGCIWMASAYRMTPSILYEPSTIYAIPPEGLNKRGIPIYRWANAVKSVDAPAGRRAIGQTTEGDFEWKMVNRASDGTVYALATSSLPSLPQDSARWMGGNLLFAFSSGTNSTPGPLIPKWHVTLPEKSVGMSPIPGSPGGVMVGIRPWKRGTIGHYSKDGLLIGSFCVAPEFGDDGEPNIASGAFDSFLAVNCNRDPRDGLLDVFAEDNHNQRIIWYRIDDSKMETSTGTGILAATGTGARYPLTVNQGTGDGNYAAGSVVPIAANVPPPGQAFAAWTGDTTGVANIRAATTTYTMPAAAATLTPTYTWATGADKIRFAPAADGQSRLRNTLFEGTNGDPVKGPYTPIYAISTELPAGWSEVSVDLKDYRYLRWRDPNSNGMIADIEFYRKGKKLAGTGYGTPGSWGDNPNVTFEKALDGDLTTLFNGPDSRNNYIGIDTFQMSLTAKTLTVTAGTGSGRYDPGTTVKITAEAPPKGQRFKKWTGDIAIISNPFLSTTSITMPSQDVSLMATYDK